MKEIVVAQRYAKALFQVASQRKQVTEVQRGLKRLNQILRVDQALGQMVRHPLISVSEKKRLLLQSVGAVPPLLEHFLEILLTKKRMNLITWITVHFDLQQDEAQGIQKAYVKTALPLDAMVKETIKKKLEKFKNKQIALEVTEDPKLLAGLLVQIGDQVIDLTLSGQLQALSTHLSKIQLSVISEQ